jgi:hypothetical protein
VGKQVFKIYLQIQRHGTKKLRSEFGKVSCKLHRVYWNKFVKQLEHDITGPTRRGFIMSTNFQAIENDQLGIKLIPKDYLEKHCRSLWIEEQQTGNHNREK